MSLVGVFSTGLMSTANATSYPCSGQMNAEAHALVVAFVTASATAAAGTMTGGGLTWVLQDSQVWFGTNKTYLFTALVDATPVVDMLPTFDCTGDAATGCCISVFEFNGALTSDPVRQTAKNTGNSALGQITFGSNRLDTNGYVAVLSSQQGSPPSTPPAGWDNILTGGEAGERIIFDFETTTVPVFSHTVCGRIHGETGTTVAFDCPFGQWAMIGIEINEGPNVDMRPGKYWGG